MNLPESRIVRAVIRCGALAPLLAGTLSTSGCFFDFLTAEEFRLLIDETVLQGEVMGMENEVLEISTSFTIADGVEAVIEEVRAFAESQVPCSTITVEDQTMTFDFGTLDDDCRYNGHTYAGVFSSRYEVQGDSVLVTHSYDGFTNGSATLEGDVNVTWTSSQRQVQSDLVFSKENLMVAVQADRVQTLVDPSQGLAGGIEINGTREWQGQSGDWRLGIDEVEVRGIDPVPQAGRYDLDTPFDGKTVSMSFDRQDEDTIRVLVESGSQSRKFDVTSTGRVTDQGE